MWTSPFLSHYAKSAINYDFANYAVKTKNIRTTQMDIEYVVIFSDC